MSVYTTGPIKMLFRKRMGGWLVSLTNFRREGGFNHPIDVTPPRNFIPPSIFCFTLNISGVLRNRVKKFNKQKIVRIN